MKNKIATLLIAFALLMTACDDGNPQGAVGAKDEPDSTAFDRDKQDNGRPEATPDTGKTVGPGNDKNHVSDTEDKAQHHQ